MARTKYLIDSFGYYQSYIDKQNNLVWLWIVNYFREDCEHSPNESTLVFYPDGYWNE